MKVRLTPLDQFPLLLKGGRVLHCVPGQQMELDSDELTGIAETLIDRGQLQATKLDDTPLTSADLRAAPSPKTKKT